MSPLHQVTHSTRQFPTKHTPRITQRNTAASAFHSRALACEHALASTACQMRTSATLTSSKKTKKKERAKLEKRKLSTVMWTDEAEVCDVYTCITCLSFLSYE